MSNEVRILITSADHTDFSAFERKAQAEGKRIGKKYSDQFTAETKRIKALDGMAAERDAQTIGKSVGKKYSDALVDETRASEQSVQDSGKRAGEKYEKEFTRRVEKIGDRIADPVDDGSRRAEKSIGKIGDSVKRLDKDIETHKRRVVELGTEYARTGDKDVFRGFQNARSALGQLETVKRDVVKFRKTVEEEGHKSGRGFISRFGSGMKTGSSGVGRTLGNVVMMGGKGPLIIAATALVGTFMGAIGAALSGAALVGTIGLGAFFMREEPAVVKAARTMISTVKNVFTEASQPLAKPLVGALRMIETRAHRLGPVFRQIFADAAPYVGQLTDALLGVVENLLPVFMRMMSNAGPVVDGLGRAFEVLGQDAATALDILTSDAEGSAQGIEALAHVVGDLVIAIAWIGKIAQDAFEPFARAINGSKGLMREALEAAQGFGGSMGEMAEKALQQMDAQDAANRAVRQSAKDMSRATAETNRLRRAQGFLANQLLELSEAEISVEEAIDDATASLKENGKHLDTNSVKGQRNVRALNQIARSALAYQEAGKAAGTSTTVLNAKMGRAYSAFVKTARGMGMGTTEAHKLARSLGLIPKTKVTKISIPGGSNAIATARSVAAAVRSIPGSKTVHLNVQKAYSMGAGWSSWYNSLRAGGGPLPHAAEGGARSSLVEVGEQGREIIDMRTGTVYPNANKRKQAEFDALANGGGSQRVVLELKSSGQAMDDMLVKMLRSAIHVRGGDVQAVLGRGW